MFDVRRLFDTDPAPDPCEPGTEVIEREDLVLRYRRSATRAPWTSSVLRARWREADAERGIDEVMRYFAERDSGFTWHVSDADAPLDLGARLERRGFVLDALVDKLVATLPIVGLRTNPAIAIREVTDETTLRDSVQAQHPDWEKERREALIRERRAYLACDGHLRHFAVAYLDEQPIASARWRVDEPHRAVLLTGAETLPEFRNRGAYSTLVDYRAARGLERDCRYATILADVTTSAPILRKRGFAPVGRATVYLWPGSRSSSS
jgi:hypothetical protein